MGLNVPGSRKGFSRKRKREGGGVGGTRNGKYLGAGAGLGGCL